jgi:hypothetical protein
VQLGDVFAEREIVKTVARGREGACDLVVAERNACALGQDLFAWDRHFGFDALVTRDFLFRRHRRFGLRRGAHRLLVRLHDEMIVGKP